MTNPVNLQDPVTSNLLSLGQQFAANSLSVVLASDAAEQPVFLTDSNYQTYSVGVSNLTPASSATDILEIDGPPLNNPFTFRLTQLIISANQTTSGWVNVLLQKRSSLNSGGTFTTPTPVVFSNSSSAPVTVVKAYTSNPTLGTLVGTVAAFKLWVPATNVAGNPFVLDFGTRITQQIFLENNECLVVNLGGKTVSGGSFDFAIEWTEWY